MSDAPQIPFNPQPSGQPGGQPRQLNAQNDIINPLVGQLRGILSQTRNEITDKVIKDISPEISDIKASIIALGKIMTETSPVSKPSREVDMSKPSFYIPLTLLIMIAVTMAGGFYVFGANFKTYFDSETQDQSVVNNILIGSMIFFAGLTLSLILIFSMLIYIINSL
jgi:hypothetical protein